MKKTNEQFLLELASINDKILPEELYINSSTPIKCKCKVCNYTWYARPNSLLKGHGCPFCAGNIKKSNSDFLSEMSLAKPDIEVLGTYTGNKNPIKCKCKKCGHIWEKDGRKKMRISLKNWQV